MISTVLPAFDYLINTRKLTEETIRTFGLSYCDSKGEIYVDADFVGTFPSLNNIFKHSSLFPILDLYGSMVGVSARPLTVGSNAPKYINTVYDKSMHLYGLNVTWKECLKQQKVYVVEGNVDTLMMHQKGIKNVVGMLGSAFSFTQLCLLSRFVKKIIFVPDGDTAGSKLITRLKKAIPNKFYDADVTFLHVQLPQGLDPDNYLKTYTKDDFFTIPEQELSLL